MPRKFGYGRERWEEGRVRVDVRRQARILESANALSSIAEATKPVLERLSCEQQDFSALLRQVTPPLELFQPPDAISALVAETSAVSRMFRDMQRSLEPLENIRTATSRILGDLNAASSLASVARFDALIGLETKNVFRDALVFPPELHEIGVGIRDLVVPTIPAFGEWRNLVADLRLPGFQVETGFREHFLSVDILDLVVEQPQRGSEAEDTRDETIGEIDAHFLLTLPVGLAELDPELCPLWEGAWAAAHSNLPDRTRHALASARELMTHVMHKLAPDAEVKASSTSNADFERGRPTRQARLAYALSPLNSPLFEKYLAKEIAVALDLMDFLNGGTHAIRNGLTEDQLRAVFRKLHCTLCTLMEAKSRPTGR